MLGRVRYIRIAAQIFFNFLRGGKMEKKVSGKRAMVPALFTVTAFVAFLFGSATLASAGNPTAGAKIFAENCASCHGDHGQGRGGPEGWFTGGGMQFGESNISEAVGNRLNDQEFLAITSDEFLKATILKGRSNERMPGGLVNEQQADDVVAFIRTWQKVPNRPVMEDTVWADAGAGAIIYEQSCRECHGANGEGIEGWSPALNDQNFLDTASDDWIRQTIQRGRQSSVMRPFERGNPLSNTELEAREIENVVAFIRTWDKNNKAQAGLNNQTHQWK